MLLSQNAPSEIQSLSYQAVLTKLKTALVGLTSLDARVRRNGVVNKITEPSGLSRYFCCLLACFGISNAMDLLRKVTPNAAVVKRDQRIINIDPISLVIGDIIIIKPNDYVPADCRIIEVIEECTFDTSVINNKEESHTVSEHIYSNIITESPNIALVGYKCIQGSCVGVIYAIGSDTYLAKLVSSNNWPNTGKYQAPNNVEFHQI